MGWGAFCAHAARCGVDGVLVTDIIVEEAEEYLTEMHHNGLMPIFLAAPTSSDHRLKIIAGLGGIRLRYFPGGDYRDAAEPGRGCAPPVDRLRHFTELPIAVGFGISTAEHVAAVSEFADAAAIGTAIVALIEKSGPGTAPARVAAFLQGLRQNQQTAASLA